ncbi:MAG: DUF1849 family protein [Dongiaceae bacterium]
MTLTARLAAAVLMLIVAAAANPAPAAQVAPHRASYELSLDSANPASDVVDVQGSMEFEWADSCSGWTVTQKSLMTVTYSSNESAQIGWSLLSWESKDGLKYRFLVRDLQNGEMADQYRGEAALDAPGKAGRAVYSLPSRKTVQLPAGTLFPTAHSLELLRHAEAGDTLMWREVFDGSDDKGLFGVNAVIGKPRKPAEPAGIASPLLNGDTWPILLAYFSAEGQAAEPTNEQRLSIHENGVVEELRIDYGNFRVIAKLKQIAPVKPSC